MTFLRFLIPTLLFAAILGLAPDLVTGSLRDQKAKSQIASINHIMYGIFNVGAWKQQIGEIVISEVQKIDLKGAANKLHKTIEDQLTAVIDKLNEQIRESNKGSLTGKIKQVLINLVVDVETIKKGAPKYADAIIEQIGKPETQKTIKDMATQQVRAYLKKSYTEQDTGPLDQVLKETQTNSVEEATKRLHDEIDSRKVRVETHAWLIIASAILLFVWAWPKANRTRYTVTILFSTLVILLLIGVSIPMIDLEAKIEEMSFVLMGHKIVFQNQILYFQSKSVLNVFWLMITHADLKMKAVGVLLITFSIIVPILKMGASVIFFFSEKRRSSKLLQVLAFKIGKWSMADVMVIAIMMTYIGFNGIVEAQFVKMKAAVPKDVSFFTTNGTSLQVGYYIFISYVLLAMVLSSYVKASQNMTISKREFDT